MMPHPSEGLKVVTIRIAAIAGVTGIASITAVSAATVSATILRLSRSLRLILILNSQSPIIIVAHTGNRSEERRVGKECRL